MIPFAQDVSCLGNGQKKKGVKVVRENLLRAKIVEKGFTVESFCVAAGFNRSTFDRKLTGQNEFTRAEIEKIIVVLCLSDEEVRRIFFPNTVS